MPDATSPAGGERKLRLRFDGRCRICDSQLPAGSYAFWDAATRTLRCLTCSPSSALEPALSTSSSAPPVASSAPGAPDLGVAGASARRRYELQEGRRRARLRANWRWIVLASVAGALAGAVLTAATHTRGPLLVLLGAVIPVMKLLPTPQHIDAWRSGADGERLVGSRLDALRTQGVSVVHDRRVPGSRANIDHIAVCKAGVFVIDTKNVAGKVAPSRSGLRVAGRRRDEMITGVQGQVAVVRRTLEDQRLEPHLVRGVLCFTRAELPWFRPAPGGVQLLYPKGLARLLRRPGPLTGEQVRELTTLLANRLPAA